MLTSKGELKSEDNCLDYNGYDLYLRDCDGLMQNQRWQYKAGIKLNFTQIENYFHEVNTSREAILVVVDKLAIVSFRVTVWDKKSPEP